MTEFDVFWARYPHRVGKLAAQKAFTKARKLASVEAIVQGVDRYIANKPSYADFCHPATFLNQGRWMDEYVERRSGADRRDEPRGTPERRDYEWMHECAALHGGDCGSHWRHHQRLQLDAMRKGVA